MIIDIYITIVAFILGASVGSFLNALCERVYNHEPFVIARSVCRSCNKELSVLDLIPFFSFLFLRGKCRYCKAKLPMDLFLSEIILGVLFSLSYFVARPLILTDMTMFYLYWGFLLFNISFFFFIALYDFKYYIIPDLAVYGLSMIYIIIIIDIFVLNKTGLHVLYYADVTSFMIQHFITAIALLIFFLSIYLVTQGRGLGGGDVKLVFLIGLLLGAKPSIVFLYVAFFSGALVSILLLVVKTKQLKDAIPFGPFLAFGVIIAILYSGVLLSTPLFSFVNYLGAIV